MQQMTCLGTLLSSAARTEILRALYYQPQPAGLRPLARIAGILPRSAEVALQALVDEKRVKRTLHDTGPRYGLNRRHPDAALLDAVFTAAARATIASRCQLLKPRAARILPLVHDVGRLAVQARGAHHVA